MKPVIPPNSRLPAGATAWATVEAVAIALGKDVRTVKDWCAHGLVYCEELAGGYGGRWIAVTEGCWPITGPGVEAYRSRRSAAARVGGVKGAAASVAARAARKARRQPRRSA